MGCVSAWRSRARSHAHPRRHPPAGCSTGASSRQAGTRLRQWATGSLGLAGANVERLILIEGSAINGVGNSQSNILSGNSSSNTLNGRAGNDTLIGRPGRDRFRFNTAPNTSTNYDTITDFKAADDTVLLDNSVFTGLPATGTLAPAAFATGTAATITMHRIIYDPVTGNVWYDRDGVGGAAAVRFAQLTTKPALTNADFHVQ